MSAAVHAATGLDAVADDATPAVIARRRQNVNRALEGVVGSRTAAWDLHRHRRVVVVAADVTGCHGDALPGPTARGCAAGPIRARICSGHVGSRVPLARFRERW